MRSTLFTLIVALAASSDATAHVQAGRMLLIKLEKPSMDDAEARANLAALPLSAELGLSLEKRTVCGWLVASLPADKATTSEAIDRLRSEKGVSAAEPMTMKKALRAPNDELYGELWAFHGIGIEDAWDTTVGLSSQRIGMIDSGINRDHIDLIEHDVFGYDFVSDTENAGDGSGRDGDYTDADSGGGFHGSHVAGTMVASANDAIGVPGVNWNAGLVTARAIGALGGSVVDIAEAAVWLAGGAIDGVPSIGAHRVSVINMSLGSDDPCGAFESDVYSAITAAGVTVVAAAGNTSNFEPTGSPASCPGVIAVAASNRDFALSSYSNFDARIDVVAPGGDGFAGDPFDSILSVDGSGDSSYVAIDGTSMASPHVAGVVSLMQAVNPRLSPRQIAEILHQSPYTCSGCENEAYLDAPSAVAMAATVDGELTDAPGGGGGGDEAPDASCPAHSQLTADGQFCECDAGYVVNASSTACVLPDEPDDNAACSPNSTLSSDGTMCICDPGFVVNGEQTACVADDDGVREDDEAEGDDPGSRSYLSGCSATGQSTLAAGLALLALLAARRRGAFHPRSTSGTQRA